MDEREMYIEFITNILEQMDLRRIKLIYRLAMGLVR